jgi:8-oxo-dGTP pyrophosphatase MutT (NUDIX family)
VTISARDSALDSGLPRSASYSRAWLAERLARGCAKDTLLEGDQGGAVANDRGELTRASVLIPVVGRASGLTVLFTQRTAHLHDHAGQISFPGGRAEAGDASAVATALRETFEEVGIAAERFEILGQLPEYLTRTGYCVTPVVGFLVPPFELTPDTFEVAEIFEVPLAFLLDPANHQRQSIVHEGIVRQFWAMPYEGRYIWGATAGMLMNFYRCLMSVSA